MSNALKPAAWLKPGALAIVTIESNRVERYRRKFIGELVSFPTPENTIMVRQVPGLAATVIEVPLCRIEKPNQTYRYVHYTVVKPKASLSDLVAGLRSSFPEDMLRYDYASPANFSINDNGQAILEEGHKEYIIASAWPTKKPLCWTPARWASFGWELSHLKTEKIHA